MASKQIRITDTFQENVCGICGCKEINQFFGVNENFIEYCNVYYSFREILSEALDIQIDHNSGKTMEICLDCKDKVIKFYHFKRKVKEVQMNFKNTSEPKEFPKISEKRSKIVHDIYQIIENYTEKCSVSSIRVNENGKKLIIESSSNVNNSGIANSGKEKIIRDDVEEERQAFLNQTVQQQYESDIFSEPAVTIKEEPQDLISAIRYAHAQDNENDNYNSEGMGLTEEESYSNPGYITPSTSQNDQLPKRARRDDTRNTKRRNSQDSKIKPSMWCYARKIYHEDRKKYDAQCNYCKKIIPGYKCYDKMKNHLKNVHYIDFNKNEKCERRNNM